MEGLFEKNTIIVGGQGSGKSCLARTLSKLKGVKVFTAGEPIEVSKKTKLIVIDECHEPIHIITEIDVVIVLLYQEPTYSLEFKFSNDFETITIEEAKARLSKYLLF